MSKLGRPTEDPAVNRIALRLTGMDIQKLNECSNILELSKTDVIRRGIDELYKKIKEGEKMKREYYTYLNEATNETMCCVVGTTFCIPEDMLFDLANDNGWELEKIDTPDGFDPDEDRINY